MGYFSSYMGGSTPTKYLVAGRVAALIKCVRYDVSVSGLIAGSIVLNRDFTVAFRGGGGTQNSNYLAKVSLKIQFERIINNLIGSELSGFDVWAVATVESVIVDMLTYAVITEFEKQSTVFNKLNMMFKPTGNYVFVGKSVQYREAEKRRDQNEMGRLLRQGDETHYLMETYESRGEAKSRETKMAGTFVGGVVDSFELLIG